MNKLKKKAGLFPRLLELSDAQLAHIGIAPERMAAVRDSIVAERKAYVDGLIAQGVEPRVAASAYDALNWNVVSPTVIQGWNKEMLSPIESIFSTNISGDTVPADAPDAMPSVTVPVVSLGEDGAQVLGKDFDLDSLDSGAATGVQVPLQLVAAGCTFPMSALMDGYQAETLVAGCIESVRRKAFALIMAAYTAADVKDSGGKTIAAVETITVPGLEDGWGAGYVNRHLSEVLGTETCSLLVNPAYYAGLKKENNDDLSLEQVDMENVLKSGQMSALGSKAVGLLAAPNSMAVAMRAPGIPPNETTTVFQLVDGDTRLPLTVVQYFVPNKLALRTVVMTAIGAKRVAPANARILATA